MPRWHVRGVPFLVANWPVVFAVCGKCAPSSRRQKAAAFHAATLSRGFVQSEWVAVQVAGMIEITVQAAQDGKGVLDAAGREWPCKWAPLWVVARYGWAYPSLRRVGVGQKPAVVVDILPFYIGQTLLPAAQPQQKALGLFAIAAQGGGALGVFCQPHQYSLGVTIGADQAVLWGGGEFWQQFWSLSLVKKFR